MLYGDSLQAAFLCGNFSKFRSGAPIKQIALSLLISRGTLVQIALKAYKSCGQNVLRQFHISSL